MVLVTNGFPFAGTDAMLIRTSEVVKKGGEKREGDMSERSITVILRTRDNESLTGSRYCERQYRDTGTRLPKTTIT